MKKIKDNLGTVIVTSLVIMLHMLIGLCLWNKLPKQVPVHFDFTGAVDGWSSKAFAVFGVPGMILAVHIFCMITVAVDPKEQGISDKIYKIVLWIAPLISVCISVLIYGNALELPVDVVMITQLFIGVLYCILGNFMPKARRNYTYGMRVRWALDSEKNWSHTNRIAGWCMIVGGFLFIISGLTGALAGTGQSVFLITLFVAVMVMTIIPCFYSYFYYLKHREDEDYYA